MCLRFCYLACVLVQLRSRPAVFQAPRPDQRANHGFRLPKAASDSLHKQNLPFRLPPTMPVPWEALIPFGADHYLSQSFVRASAHNLWFFLGLMTAMFGTAGTLMNVSKRGQNLGKARTHSLQKNYLGSDFAVRCCRARDTTLIPGKR